MAYEHFASQAEIDAQYNVREHVPDFSRHVDLFVSRSARAREELPCLLSLPFGPSQAEFLDVFPAERPHAPILMFWHGGYWRAFSAREFSFVALGLVAAGVTVVVVNYALCPEVTLDEIVRQSRAAVAWVYRNAASIGGSGDEIFVSGHSAGGHLTAMLMATDWECQFGMTGDVIKGGCAISGLFDLRPFPRSWLQPVLRLTEEQVQLNSPLFLLPERAAPLIVAYGGEESSELRRQSEEYLAAWKARGLAGEALALPGANHFSVLDEFLDAESRLCRTLLRRVRSVTAGRNDPE